MNEELMLRQNVLYCRGGSMPLGPVHHAMVMMLKANPGGMTTKGMQDRTGQTLQSTQVEIYYLQKKLAKVGWTVKNIGCKGRGMALYILAKEGGLNAHV